VRSFSAVLRRRVMMRVAPARMIPTSTAAVELAANRLQENE
jgi:hypothetical protein